MIAEIDYGATKLRRFQLLSGGLPYDYSGFTVDVLVYLIGGPVWAAATAYAVGDLIRPTIGNGQVYRCTTAGTSDAVLEPDWTGDQGTPGGVMLDGTVVWTDITPVVIPVVPASGYVDIDGLEALPRDTSFRVRYLITDGVGDTELIPDKNRYDVWRVSDPMAH